MSRTPVGPAEPQILTVADIARILRISERTARQLMSTTLPKIRVATRRVGVLATDLQTYIESRREMAK